MRVRKTARSRLVFLHWYGGLTSAHFISPQKLASGSASISCTMFRLPLRQIIFMQLATWHSLQRIDIIQLLSPLSHSIHNFFYRSISSRLYITPSANFSGLAVTSWRRRSKIVRCCRTMYIGQAPRHTNLPPRVLFFPLLHKPPTKLLALLHSRFSMLSLTAQTMARSLSLMTC